MEEHTLWEIEKSVQRRIYGTEKKEVAKDENRSFILSIFNFVMLG
jgi:hypothetical protein